MSVRLNCLIASEKSLMAAKTISVALGVSDAWSGRGSDNGVMRPIMGKCWAEIVAWNTMLCPCTPFFKCLMDEY